MIDVRAGTLSLDHLTLTGGNANGAWDFDGRGGGIRSFGDLAMADVTVRGNRMGSPEISGGGGVAALGNLVVSRSTITGNFSEGGGGGIDAQGPSTVITDASISGNRSSSFDAPSHNYDTPGLLLGGGAARVEGSTITGNESGQDRTDVASGGVLVTAAEATIVNSTISDNHLGRGDLTDYLGGVHGTVGLTARGGSLDLVDVTITGNSGVGDAVELNVQGGPVTMAGSIVAGTVGAYGLPGPDCLGTPVSAGWNIVSDDSCGLDGPGDRSSTDPEILPLADNGGPTPTQVPFAASPAVDAVPLGTVGLCDGSPSMDQRGVARPQGTACDIGAVEGSGPALTPLALVVDSAVDAVDAAPGDGICADISGACTLRAAIEEANRRPGSLDNAITIADGIDPRLSLPNYDTPDDNASADLDVAGSLTIDGSGQTLDAADWPSVHLLEGRLTIRDLTISDVSGRSYGGGTLLANGDLTLIGVTVTMKGTGFTPTPYGSVAIIGGHLSVVSSAIVANVEDDGAVIDVRAGASATITNSTISGNSGHAVQVAGGTVALVDSTIVGVPDRSVLYVLGGGSITTAGSILFSTGVVCSGPVTSLGWNIVADASCGVTASGDHQSTDPLLGPLADNGGPTLSRLPAATSVAVDAVAVGTAGLCDGSVPTDQRGIARPRGPACDIGAVER